MLLHESLHEEMTKRLTEGLRKKLIKPELEQVFFNVFQAMSRTESPKGSLNKAEPLELLLAQQPTDELVESLLVLLEINNIIHAFRKYDPNKPLDRDHWSKIYQFHENFQPILFKIILRTPKFKDVDVQVKILPDLIGFLFDISLNLSYPNYPDAMLAVWMKDLFDIQRSVNHSDQLKEMIAQYFLRDFHDSKYFFTNLGYKEVYQRRLDVLSLPIHQYENANFPLELMSFTTLEMLRADTLQMGAADIPAVWAYHMWQSVEQMPASSRAIWLNILQHAGQMTLAVEATWLEQANALVAQLPTAEFNQTLQQWLKWIAAEVPRKTAPLSNHNKPFVLGLLGFASLGQAKTMEKILLKYHKFFQMKCHHLNKRSAAVVKMSAYAMEKLGVVVA